MAVKPLYWARESEERSGQLGRMPTRMTTDPFLILFMILRLRYLHQ